jgi:hypothetical protein
MDDIVSTIISRKEAELENKVYELQLRVWELERGPEPNQNGS